jgi:hypothetical protein
MVYSHRRLLHRPYLTFELALALRRHVTHVASGRMAEYYYYICPSKRQYKKNITEILKCSVPSISDIPILSILFFDTDAARSVARL